MRTAKVAIFLSVMFVMALAAGVVAGRLMSRPPMPAVVSGGSPLAQELQLSPDQADRMRPIWEAARDAARDCAKEAERIQREHDEQLKALLTDEQKARYEQISQENHRRIAEQDAKRKKAFREAVELTKKILRPDQQRAYEQIIKNQVGATAGIGEDPASGQ